MPEQVEAGVIQLRCGGCGGYTMPWPTDADGPPPSVAADHEYVEGSWVRAGMLCPACVHLNEE